MASPLSFQSKRSPGQNALTALFITFVSFTVFGILPTQWFAAQYHYDLNLGGAIVRGAGMAFYMPTDWIQWGWRLADVNSIKRDVHIMLLLGTFSVLLAILFGAYSAYRLGKYSSGMDGLHGTAHFAERDDIDKTGFIDARGYKSDGVIVGSVLLDRRGRVIHPHHPQFKERYVPIFSRGSWRELYRKLPKRDANNRPMYKVRKSLVRKVALLRDGMNTHLFAFCPTRSGKGTGMVIPTLLTWRHSVMVNDPKGEAYALSAGFRQAVGQDILKFEPACTNGTGARWNPLDEIRTFTLFDVSDAQMIMSMACDPKGEGLNDYFDKAGYEFLTALALHVRYAEKNGSLAGVAYFLGDPEWDSDMQMYAHMMNSEHDPDGKMKWTDSLGKSTKTHPMIANAAKTMLNKEDKDRSGVLSTAKSLLSLYLDPIVALNTSSSDFLVRDLMTGEKPVSLYYVVAPSDMERLVSLTRLFYALFIRRNAIDMEFEGGRSVKNYTHQLLMIIDEATSLRKLPILQEALGYVAGYGIRLFMLVQDITQVEELYGDKQSFDSGAETRVAYAPNKIETAEKLARMSGKTTVTEENASKSRDVFGMKAGSVSISTSKTARDLITSEEFTMLHDQDVVVFIKGQPPVYGRKAFYYDNPILVGRASMLPPARSSVLRIANDRESKTIISDIKPPDPATEKWESLRAALKDTIASKAGETITLAMPPDEKIGMNGEKIIAVAKVKSRYAERLTIMSESEKLQVQALVESVALTEKITKLSAF